MSIRKFGDRWGIDVCIGVRRVRKRSPENSRQGALAYEAKLRKKLVWGEPLREEILPTTFERFSAEWFEAYVKTNNKPSEQGTKASHLRLHLVPFLGKMKLTEITAFHIEQLKARLLGEGLMPKTVNNILLVLGKCLRSAEEWGRMGKPPRIKPLRTTPPKIRFLTRAECDALLASAAGTRWGLMLLTGLHTGLRLGELLALDFRDIDFEYGRLFVRRAFAIDLLTTPKNGRERAVPLSRVLHSELEAVRKPSGFVFSVDGGPWNRRAAGHYILTIARRAGLGKIGWHTLRHSFASHLAMAGVPLRTIQEFLGHSTIQMTARYAHISPQASREAITRIESFGVNGYGTSTALIAG